MKLDRLDHLVLTVRDINATCAFYTQVLGMQEVTGNNRKALMFGNQKLNLHPLGNEFQPHALMPMAGSADLCFITSSPLEDVKARLLACGVAIEMGIVQRTGAMGAIDSLYIRDPDGNLLEISNERPVVSCDS